MCLVFGPTEVVSVNRDDQFVDAPTHTSNILDQFLTNKLDLLCVLDVQSLVKVRRQAQTINSKSDSVQAVERPQRANG